MTFAPKLIGFVPLKRADAEMRVVGVTCRGGPSVLEVEVCWGARGGRLVVILDF